MLARRASVRADTAGSLSPDSPQDSERSGLLQVSVAAGEPKVHSSPLASPQPQPQQPAAAAPSWYKYGAFFALVVIQVSLALSFKAAQDGSGRYPFSPPAMLILSEFCKLLLSLGSLALEVSAADLAAAAVGGSGSAGSSREAGSEGAAAGGEAGAAGPGTAGAEGGSSSSSGGSSAVQQQQPASHSPTLALRLRAAWARFQRDAFGSLGGRLPAYCAGLALLYCVNNNITFVIFQWADGGNINLIKAGSTFVSALILLLLLGRSISSVQWSAIAIQSAGLVITQFGANCKAANTPALAPPVYAALLFSLTITAFSGVCNEKVLKDAGREGAGVHTVNALLYATGTLLNLGVHLGGGGTLGSSFFAGMGHPASLAVLLCNSLIGIAVGAVYKYADAVVKSFASACSTAVLFLVGAAFFGVSVNVVVAAGCVCIFVATHLYATNPAAAAPAPAPVAAPAPGALAEAGGSSSGSSAAGAAAAASPKAAEGGAAASPGEGSSGSLAVRSFSSLVPQTRRDVLLLALCGFLLLVVVLEPYFIQQRVGGSSSSSGVGGGRRLVSALCDSAVGKGAPLLQGDLVSACFL